MLASPGRTGKMETGAPSPKKDSITPSLAITSSPPRSARLSRRDDKGDDRETSTMKRSRNNEAPFIGMRGLPMPVKIDREGRGGLLNIAEQRRLRRRWSGGSNGTVAPVDDSDSGSSDEEDRKRAVARRNTAPVNSSAQKVWQCKYKLASHAY